MFLHDVLQKPQKTQDDGYIIFNKLRDLTFFKDFFARNLKTFDLDGILYLCQTLEYKQLPMGSVVFKKGDDSDKFYVILSGQVGVVVPNTEKRGLKNKRYINQPPIQQPKVLTRSKSKLNSKMHSMSRERSMDSQDQDKGIIPHISNKSNVQHDFPSLETLRTLEESPGRQAKTARESLDNSVRRQYLQKIDYQDIFDDLNDVKRQKKYDPLFGGFIYEMNKGESFGEAALKSDAPRSASTFCKSDCELLVISKRHFAVAKMRKERKKEDFLKLTFPFLNVEAMSTTGFSYILTAFKTEVYQRGSYVVVEGKIENKEPKFFVIHKGECVIEKNVSTTLTNMYDTPQFAPIGKGAVIGEEILITGDEYSYSVKAVSDNVQVHAVTKKDYESKLFVKFNDQLIRMYEKKKQQREVTFMNVKKEHEARLIQARSTSAEPKELEVKDMIDKSTLEIFHRLLDQDKRASSPNGSPIRTIMKHARLCNNSRSESRLAIKRSELLKGDLLTAVPASVISEAKSTSPEKRKVIKLVEAEDPEKQIIESKVKFLAKQITIDKKDDVESIKLFGSRKRQQLRKQSPGKGKSIDASISGNFSPTTQTNLPYEPMEHILKELAKGAKRFKMFNQKLIDVKNSRNAETVIENSVEKNPKLLILDESGCTNLAFKKVFSDDTKVKSSFRKKFVGLRPQSSTRIRPYFDRCLSPADHRQSPDKSCEESTRRGSVWRGSSCLVSYNDSLMDVKESNLDETERQIELKVSGRTINKYIESSMCALSCDFLEENQTSRSPNDKSQRSPRMITFTESPISKASTNPMVKNLASRLHGNSNNVCFNQLFNAREWRKKIFKKTPKIKINKGSLEQIQLVNSFNNALSERK